MFGVAHNFLFALERIRWQLFSINNSVEEHKYSADIGNTHFKMTECASDIEKQTQKLAKLNTQFTQALVRHGCHDISLEDWEIAFVTEEIIDLNFLKANINANIQNIFTTVFIGYGFNFCPKCGSSEFRTTPALSDTTSVPQFPELPERESIASNTTSIPPSQELSVEERYTFTTSIPPSQELSVEERYTFNKEIFHSLIETLESILTNIQTEDNLNSVCDLVFKADKIIRGAQQKMLCDKSSLTNEGLYKELRSILEKEPEQNLLKEISYGDFKFSNLEEYMPASKDNRLRAVQRTLALVTLSYIEAAVERNDNSIIKDGLMVLEKIQLDKRDSFEGTDNPAHYLYGQLYTASQLLRNENPELGTIDENSGDFRHDFGKLGWMDDRVHSSVKERALAEFHDFINVKWYK